jgi:hypothetical protein
LSREDVDDSDPASIRSALRHLCTRVSTNLRSSLGDDGYAALVRRALARAQHRHPVLGKLAEAGQPPLDLPSIVERADAQTAPAVAEAVESLLAVLVESLSALIGTEMTVSLLEHDVRSPSQRRKNNENA